MRSLSPRRFVSIPSFSFRCFFSDEAILRVVLSSVHSRRESHLFYGSSTVSRPEGQRAALPSLFLRFDNLAFLSLICLNHFGSFLGIGEPRVLSDISVLSILFLPETHYSTTSQKGGQPPSARRVYSSRSVVLFAILVSCFLRRDEEPFSSSLCFYSVLLVSLFLFRRGHFASSTLKVSIPAVNPIYFTDLLPYPDQRARGQLCPLFF